SPRGSRASGWGAGTSVAGPNFSASSLASMASLSRVRSRRTSRALIVNRRLISPMGGRSVVSSYIDILPERSASLREKSIWRRCDGNATSASLGCAGFLACCRIEQSHSGFSNHQSEGVAFLVQGFPDDFRQSASAPEPALLVAIIKAQFLEL